MNKSATQEFYSEIKKANLEIENKVHFKNLNIIINNRYVDTNLKKRLIKEGKIDISHYLKKGKNIVTYQIDGDKESGDVKFFIKPEE